MAKKRGAARAELFKTIDRRMYLAFLALMVLAPLAFARTPIEWLVTESRGLTFDQFDIVKLVTLRSFTLVILAFWVFKLWKARDARVRFTVLDGAVVAFLLLAAVSTIFSWDFATSLNGKFKRYEGLLSYINYAVLYFLALQTFYSEKRLKTLAKVMAITGGLVALYGLAQFAGHDIYQWSSLPFEQRRSFSTFGNPDLLAGYLVLTLPFSIACLLIADEWRERALFAITSALLAINVLTTMVRGAWIATAVVFVTFLALLVASYLTKKSSRESLMKVAAVLGVFVLIAGGLTISSSALGEQNLNIVERLKSMTRITEGSAGSRLEIWKASLSMIKESPVLGFGPDTFRMGSERYETAGYVLTGAGKTVADNAHNYFLQLATGPGLPAAIAFFVFALGVLFVGLRETLRKKQEHFLIATAFFTAGLGYIIHLMFGVSVIGTTSLFWVILGAIAGQTRLVREKPFNLREGFPIGLVGLVVLTSTVSFFYAGKMFAADYYYAKAMSEEGTDPTAAISDYESATSLYANGRYYDSLGTYYMRLCEAQPDQAYFNKAVQSFKQGIAIEPREADHYVFLASVYLSSVDSANQAKARSVLESALRVRPKAVPAHYLLGELDRLEKKNAQALRDYEEVIKYDPQHQQALLGMGKVYEAIGKKDKALEAYKRVVSFAPDDKDATDAIKRLQ